MNILLKSCSMFKKVMICIAATIFILICCSTVYNFTNISFGDKTNGKFTMFVGLFVSIVLLLFIFSGYKFINSFKGNNRVQYFITFSLFIITAFVFGVFLIKFNVKPVTDSFDDIDTANYLINNPKITKDNSHILTIGAFSNNYFFIVAIKFLCKALFSIGINNILMPLYIINVIAIIAGTFITWLIVLNLYSLEKANKVLLLCVLNPVYYGFTFWFYTCTLSLPIIMGIIYVAIKIYKSEKLCKTIFLGVIEGALIFIGYEIRPTSIFPFIALAICSVTFVVKKKVVAKAVMSLIAIVLTSVIMFASWSIVQNKYFGDIYDMNFPIYYWLNMGSHGNGDLSTNSDGNYYFLGFDNPEDRKNALKNSLINNYKQNGIAGTADLWYRKTMSTWSDGYTPHSRLELGETESYLIEYIVGKNKEVFQIYSQAFRLLTLLGISVLCISFIKRKHIPLSCFWFILTLLGGILFYALWEAKSIYSAPFILIMLILAQEGIEILYNKSAILHRVGNAKVCILLYLIFVLFIAIGCTATFKNISTYRYNRINSISNKRINRKIQASDNETITQDFYVDKPFMEIILLASADKVEKEKISDYTLSLKDSKGKILIQKNITSDNIKKNKIDVTFDEINSDNHYYININKKDKDKNNIYFYTKPTYYLDCYDGKLTVGEKDDYTCDLMMNVCYIEKGPYLDSEKSNTLIFLFVSVSLFTLVCTFPEIIPHKIKQKFSKV